MVESQSTPPTAPTESCDACPGDPAAVRRADTISALFQLTDRLYRARSLEETYDAALDAISHVMGTSRASILRFDTTGTMRFVAWRGLSAAYRQITDGHSPWRLGEHCAEPVYVEDIRCWPGNQNLKQTILREGIGSLAFIPLTDDGKVVGKFMVYHDAPHAFSTSERELALTVARQLGFSIQRHISTEAARRWAALVESSDDAIIGLDLEGTITNWNRGAEGLFGYTPAQAIGKPITLLIPPDRHDEEPILLARIRAGERVKHYETIRRRKDGSCVEISLTVSPILDLNGTVVGASKIARDISERRRAQEQQGLLLQEMNHRIKNLFALTSSIVHLSARTASTPLALAADVSERLTALARAHALTMPSAEKNGPAESPSLRALIQAILAPYDHPGTGQAPRFNIEGADAFVAPDAITTLALVLHEFATNAAKYGALSTPGGHIAIRCEDCGDRLQIVWRECDGPSIPHPPQQEGFGARLVQAAALQLGPIIRRWNPDGFVAELALATSHFRNAAPALRCAPA